MKKSKITNPSTSAQPISTGVPKLKAKKSSDWTAFKGLDKFFFGVFVVNIAAVMALYISKTQPSQAATETPVNVIPKPQESLKFDQPFVAYHLLKALDPFEPVDPKYYNHIPLSGNWSNFTYIGLNVDEQYCDKHRAVFASNPSFIFEQMNTLFDHWPLHHIRAKSTKGILTDFQKNVSGNIPAENKNKRLSWISPSQVYFFINNYMHNFQHLGKNFACTSQVYNHIPGDGYINRKDFVSESITKYAKKYENKPQCFSYETAFPETWVMYLKSQCQAFFNHLNSEKYTELKAINEIVYIRKVGAGKHNGNGVFSVDKEELDYIKELYANGEKCGQVKDNNIIQYFIPDPLLVYGHKFDFRTYLLVASVNPLMAYYHDGYLKVSLHKYEANSNNKFAILTNTNVSKAVVQSAMNGSLVNGMNETELTYFQRWDFERFQNYILQEGIVKDPEWINNSLRPQFKRAMIHLVRMTQDKFLKRSQIFELFGVDFMLDEKMNLWFIECNSSPSLTPTYPETEIFIRKHMEDLLDITIGLTRSRVKRIIQYVNKLTKQTNQYTIYANGEMAVQNITQKRAEFKKVILNRFESEFEPLPGNNYQMIINEHVSGSGRYMGLIADECL